MVFSSNVTYFVKCIHKLKFIDIRSIERIIPSDLVEKDHEFANILEVHIKCHVIAQLVRKKHFHILKSPSHKGILLVFL